MARRGLGRRRPPHERGGREHREPRHLRLVTHSACRRRVGLRLARPGHRHPARRRHRREPRHGDRLAAAVGERELPRDAARRRIRRVVLAGKPPALRALLPRLPAPRRRAGTTHRRALRRPPGGGDVARRQRVRLPPLDGLLRCRAGCVPSLAAREVRHRRRPQRGVGHELLVAAVQHLRRGLPPAPRALQPQSVVHARLPPVHLRHAAGVLPGGAEHPAAGRRDAADHDELHGPVQARRLSPVGAAHGRHRRRLLSRPGSSLARTRFGVPARPRALAQARRAVAAVGAGHRCRELAPGEPRQGRGGARGRDRAVDRARRRRHHVLPVAAVPRRQREVPLGDAPPRRHAHPHVARGRLPRRAPARARRAAGTGLGCAGRAGLRLGELVGGRGARPSLPDRLPRRCPGVVRRTPSPRHHGRHHRARGGGARVRGGLGARPLPAARGGSSRARPVRASRWNAAHRTLQRHRRRARPVLRRRVPHAPRRRTRHPLRGLRSTGGPSRERHGRRRARCGRRRRARDGVVHARRLCRSRHARRRGRPRRDRRGDRDLRRRSERGATGGDPSTPRRRRRVVRRHDARRRRCRRDRRPPRRRPRRATGHRRPPRGRRGRASRRPRHRDQPFRRDRHGLPERQRRRNRRRPRTHRTVTAQVVFAFAPIPAHPSPAPSDANGALASLSS